MRDADPEMFELQKMDMQLDQQARELAEQYRRAPNDGAKAEIREKLGATVKQHFEARQKRRELEIKRLEAQLERLRGSLKKRSENPDSLITQRINQLVGDDESGF